MDERSHADGSDTGEQQYVALAEVARPHGVRGELRLKVYNLDSAVLQQQRRVRLITASGEARQVRIKTVRPVPGALLVRLEGVNDRNEADELRGARFVVPREALPDNLSDDEHYVADLIGSRVLLGEQEIGRVVDVASYPTCDALVVARPQGRKLEVPLQGSYVGDIDEGIVHLESIDGLE